MSNIFKDRPTVFAMVLVGCLLVLALLKSPPVNLCGEMSQMTPEELVEELRFNIDVHSENAMAEMYVIELHDVGDYVPGSSGTQPVRTQVEILICGVRFAVDMDIAPDTEGRPTVVESCVESLETDWFVCLID